MTSPMIPARRRRGALEAALERALADLARQGRGVGADLADLRRLLRDAAMAVDLARADAQAGGSRHTLAMTVRAYLEVRTAILPLVEVTPGDPFADALADLMRAEASDTAGP